MKNRTGGIPPDVGHRPQVATPQLLALEIIGEQARASVGNIDRRSIRNRRGRTVEVGLVGRLLALERHRLAPQQFPVPHRQTTQAALGSIRIRPCHKQTPAHHDRRGIPRPRIHGFPKHTLGSRPMHRRIPLPDPITIRAAPGRPIPGHQGGTKHQTKKQKSRFHGKSIGQPGAICRAGTCQGKSRPGVANFGPNVTGPIRRCLSPAFPIARGRPGRSSLPPNRRRRRGPVVPIPDPVAGSCWTMSESMCL